MGSDSGSWSKTQAHVWPRIHWHEEPGKQLLPQCCHASHFQHPRVPESVSSSKILLVTSCCVHQFIVFLRKMLFQFSSHLQTGLFQSIQWLLGGFSGCFGLFWKRLEHKTQSVPEKNLIVSTSVLRNYMSSCKFGVPVSAFYIQMHISLFTWVSWVSHLGVYTGPSSITAGVILCSGVICAKTWHKYVDIPMLVKNTATVACGSA